MLHLLSVKRGNFMSKSKLLLSLALMFAVVGTQSAEQAIHYWSGHVRIDTTVSLDAVMVSQATPVDRERLGERAVSIGGDRLHLSVAGAQDLDALDVQVRTLGLNGRARAIVGHGSDGQARVLTRSLAVTLPPGVDVVAIAAAHGCVVEGGIPGVPGYVQLTAKNDSLLAAIIAANELQESGAVQFAIPLIERHHVRRGDPTDPLFSTQWHLKNTGPGQVTGGVAGNDINVTPVWDFTGGVHLGTGINVAMVDDGLERTHEDLVANARTDLGLNFRDGDPNDPSPGPDDWHGTWTAGLVAARDSNSKGVVGVAPRSRLIGIRLIGGATTEAKDAQAMAYQITDAGSDATKLVHVSSNSWGPDDGVVYDPNLTQAVLGPLMASALQNGVTNGRGTKGIVYVWAAGNGRGIDYDSINDVYYGGDNLSYDGLASSRYVIAVGAVDAAGAQAFYSESGPALLINAPGGGGSTSAIVTTDRTGDATALVGNYSTINSSVIGTSFATPIVAGVVALLLETNPALTWRDVKHVLARTATKNDASDSSWHVNSQTNRPYSVRYGFGRVNATAAVAAAAPGVWVNAPPETTPLTVGESVTVTVPDNNTTGITRSRTLTAPAGFRAEYVELTVSATHTYRGDLHFILTSPSGTVSDFAKRELDYGNNLNNWLFTSVAHLGENPAGAWTLQVSDEGAQDVGQLTGWSLTVHGYLSYPAASISALSPQAIAVGSGNTVVTVTGSGFVDGVTRVTSGATALVATVNSGTQLSVTVPSSLLTAHGALPITVVTPSFDAPAATPATRNLQVGSLPQFISLPPSQSLTEDTPSAALQVLIDDADNDAMTLSASSNNAAVIPTSGLVFGGSGDTRTIIVQPLPDASGGPVTITLTLTDGFNTVTSTFLVTVTAANDPPIAQGARLRTQPGFALSDVVTGFDVDGDALTFSKVADPSNGTVTVQSNGSFTYQPLSLFKGMDVFTFQVSANGQTSSPAQVFITVAGDPNGTRPLIVSEPPDEQIVVAAPGGFTYPFVVDTRRYVVAPTLSFELVGAPAGIGLNGTTRTITWTATGSDRHLSFGLVVKDSLTGALDTQVVVLAQRTEGGSHAHSLLAWNPGGGGGVVVLRRRRWW
jgi:subtilisin-like proprotein convertase family protein